MEKIRETIHQKIRPLLNSHQGDIELIEVTSDGHVKVRLSGACSTCPCAQQTMSEVVEVVLKEMHPEIKGVMPVSQVSDELIDEALKILRRNRQ